MIVDKKIEEEYPYIIWQNNGSEGWHPRRFQSLADVEADILLGGCYGPICITKRVKMELKDE